MKRFRVEINRDKCKGCELCAHACPREVLAMGAQVNRKGYAPADVIKPEACIGCASCALICPDCCITIHREEEP